ncbi:MarR family transcriptional regulator [Dyella monticola]|uniref:MarR family transcriptional regulator n=1 Tax=Dyella monticola TaxID=1927958 RepID=A0A370X534_9GAMM|nr:MarR family winged helix-turn-helix transcriptional regulator [Dyella monticola]RDS83498.1 MarR family transcriptional regulator [Dyella monticola]
MNKHLVDDLSNGTPNSNSTEPNAIDTADVDALYKMAQVSRTLKSVTCAIEKLLHVASGASDLTLMHCLVLVHLSKTATCQQADLKEATGAAAPHLTKLMDELVHRDLVCRNRSSWDRRQVIVALTAPGRETALRLLAALHGVIDKAQINAIAQLGSSLERFVSTRENNQA